MTSNQKIATLIEPNPDIREGTYPASWSTSHPEVSPLGVWRWVASRTWRIIDGVHVLDSQGHAVTDDTSSWAAADFEHDPAMMGRMLEAGKLALQPAHDGAWRCGHQWMNGTVTMWANGTMVAATPQAAVFAAMVAWVESGGAKS